MIAVEQVARGWSGFLPVELAEPFSRAEAMDANAAEESLTGLIDEHGDEPELWWMLGLTMCRQQDEINAKVCHDNFIVRVSHQIGLACDEAGHAAPIAIQRLQRLLPSLDRAGAVLAARGHIARAGLQLAEGSRIGAADSQAEALNWLRRASPRPWPIAAEWLATEAVRRSANGITYRTARTLRLAARLSRHAPEARDRTVMILRDLGLVLDRIGAVAAAEAALVEARTALDPKQYPDLAAGVAAALAENFAGQRRYLEAQAEVEAALALAASPRERANALRVAADLLVTVGRAHRDREQLIEARAHADEAIELLAEIGEDRLGAVIQRATIDALLGETVAARGELAKLLSNMSLRSLPLATRSGLSYLAWLLRFTAGHHAKALRWAAVDFVMRPRTGRARGCSCASMSCSARRTSAIRPRSGNRRWSCWPKRARCWRRHSGRAAVRLTGTGCASLANALPPWPGAKGRAPAQKRHGDRQRPFWSDGARRGRAAARGASEHAFHPSLPICGRLQPSSRRVALFWRWSPFILLGPATRSFHGRAGSIHRSW
jgi:tetratricopeptide (TPR) repeat protein